PAAEEGHAGPDDANLAHAPIPRTATAPVALGMKRHDCATPTRTPSSGRTPAPPRSWRATSAARSSPVAANTFPHPTDPPEPFTGKRPSAAYSPRTTFVPASPLFASPMDSRC